MWKLLRTTTVPTFNVLRRQALDHLYAARTALRSGYVGAEPSTRQAARATEAYSLLVVAIRELERAEPAAGER